MINDPVPFGNAPAANLALPNSSDVSLISSPEVRWHLPDELRSMARIPLDDWLAAGSAVPIKVGPHRAVWRFQIDGRDWYIKEYRSVGVRGRLRELLRPVKARREYAVACAVRERGLLAPVPVGWGVIGPPLAPTASFLITETVPDARPLQHILESEEIPPYLRHRLAHDLGQFLMRLHAKGVVHGDPHPGNFLVRWDGQRPELILLDLHTVRVGRLPTDDERRHNLALFNRYFAVRATRSDRLRFWRAYANDADPRPVERLTDELNRQLWRSRDGRCLRSNRYYRIVNRGQIRGWAVRDLPDELADQLLADPDAPFASSPLIKDTRSSTVAELNGQYIFKRFRVVAPSETWVGLARPTSALRSWVLGHGLIERRLPTARPLLLLHRYRRGRPYEGYLLTEKIEEAVELHEYARTRPPAELRGRIDQLARLIRDLHGRGVRHRDLKATNILVTAERFWLIDLVGARVVRRISRRLAVKDLSRLLVSFWDHPAITRTDKLRFLRSYRTWSLHGRAGWKRWWRELESAAMAKCLRNRRVGRIIT